MPKTNMVIIAKVFVFWILFEILVNGVGSFTPISPNWLLGISFGGGVSIVMLAVTYFFLKSETLTFANLGMSFNASSLLRLILSLVVGMAFFGCFYLLYLWLTPLIVVGIQDKSIVKIVLLSFMSLLMLAVMEEITFRGYALKKLETAIGPRGSIYLTSLAFGLYHGITFDSITGPAVWGLLYAVLAYWSKGLAAPIGFHAGCNLIQAFFGEKSRYADGIWGFELAEKITPFTIAQMSLYLHIFLFILGMVFVEIYLSKEKSQPPKL